MNSDCDMNSQRSLSNSTLCLDLCSVPSQSQLTLVQEPSRLVARIGDAEITLFVDALSGTFSMASKQLGDVASKDAVL
jgi:hypothetical protein